jgi:hypothetical protein
MQPDALYCVLRGKSTLDCVARDHSLLERISVDLSVGYWDMQLVSVVGLMLLLMAVSVLKLARAFDDAKQRLDRLYQLHWDLVRHATYTRLLVTEPDVREAEWEHVRAKAEQPADHPSSPASPSPAHRSSVRTRSQTRAALRDAQ